MSEDHTPDEEEEESAENHEVEVDAGHLDDVGDGCGCAEVWEHTSAQRG